MHFKLLGSSAVVEIQKLTDNLLRPPNLKTSPFTLSFTLSLSLVEVHQVEGEQDWTPPSWCSSPLTQGFPLLRCPLAPPCRVQKVVEDIFWPHIFGGVKLSYARL